MRYVGLDVHLRRSSICVLNEHGETVKQLEVRGPWPKLLEALRRLDPPFALCYEASCGYGYLYEQIRAIAARVVVAHPGQLRLIFRSKRKNDRVDAQKLAKLLFLDEVPPVYVPSLEVRSWRSLIEHRRRLIIKRTRAKNSLRALLRSQGVPAPRWLWGAKGLAWLKALALQTTSDQLQRDLLVEELEELAGKLRRVEDVLTGIADRHGGIVVLETIPGVGPRTAEAVLAYIDNPQRFRNSKCVGSYFGLVPSQDSSAAVNRLGHISREGPASVRQLLTEAVWIGLRGSPKIRCHYERIRQGNPERKKIAVVATAHYLVRVMHAMLRTGEAWREEAA